MFCSLCLTAKRDDFNVIDFNVGRGEFLDLPTTVRDQLKIKTH